MKLMIMGFAGSGKSTLAKRLSEKLELPVLYMDTVYWLPGWNKRPLEGQIQILERFLDENADRGWVIDGNYSKNLLERRAEEADAILYLNFSRLRCLFRILKRNARYRGKSRFSITESCEEKIDWEFIRWTMYESRTKTAVSKWQLLGERFPDKFHEFNDPRRLESFLAERGL